MCDCILMVVTSAFTLKLTFILMLQNDGQIDEDTKAFYRFYSNVMEPWDGPAMIAFTNGV